MNVETLTFLDEYKRQLKGVDSAAQLHGTLSSWSFEQRSRIAKVVDDLNDGLRLCDGAAFKDHMITTAVGDLSGVLFVSANPGWSATANAKEDRFRSYSVCNNHNFCAEFFRTYKAEVGANAWWSRALSLSHMVVTGHKFPIPPAARWNWALQGAAVGNIDLLPFHSTSDKFGLLNAASGAHQVMRSVAIATLEMVLRLQPTPRLTFVGSALGAPIANQLCEELGMQLQTAPDTGVVQFDRLRRYVDPVSGARIMTFPYQLFAGFASKYLPLGFMPDLARHIRDFAHPSF